MEKEKPYIHLNSFLAKDSYSEWPFNSFLSDEEQVTSYNIDKKHGIDGKLFIKKSPEKKPSWSLFAETMIGENIDELFNKSSSAVLIIRYDNKVFAFSFGYGRFLINSTCFVQDFGIKTALNTLNHDSLRSIDLYTFDDQAIQRRTQATRNSKIGVFGIDISKDVLRAVTGSTKTGVKYRNISGGDSVFSFSTVMDIGDIHIIAKDLYNYYNNDDYKENFLWVDNIRRIKDSILIESLNGRLVKDIKNKSDSIVITLPEIFQWDTIYGFSFTRAKKTISPTLEASHYLNNINVPSVTIDSIKRDKLFIHNINNFAYEHSVYKCLYHEIKKDEKTYILFTGLWYEIDNSFIVRVNNLLNKIEVSTLNFPDVYTWKEGNELKIESEGEWNERTASDYNYHLLDKKLIKSNRTTSSVELCDLLTNNKQFIHVKHRKGGSAGLSHLFSQGHVAAEILLGDKEFRKKARVVLRNLKTGLDDLIPLDKFKSTEYEIVYLILGESSDTLKDNLPFFSKVNLMKSFENLSQRGFKVTIYGAATKEV